MSTTARAPKNVHAAIAAVMRDVGAVGKRGRNDEAGYSFRRIEDVMDALNPVMAKHGVHVAPKVLERLVSGLRSEDDILKPRRVALRVRFRIYGPAGDHVDVTTWGEGIDAGDKATSKAHTSALKNGLLPAFMIPTHNLTVDGDTSGPTAAAPAPPAASAGLPVAEPARLISAPQKRMLQLELDRLRAKGEAYLLEYLTVHGKLQPGELEYVDAARLLEVLSEMTPQTDDGAEAAPAADVPTVEAAEGSPAPAASAPSSARKAAAMKATTS